MTPLLPDIPVPAPNRAFLSSEIALAMAAKRLRAAIKERGNLSEEQSYECAILLIEWNCSQFRLDEWIYAYLNSQAQATEKFKTPPLAPELQEAVKSLVSSVYGYKDGEVVSLFDIRIESQQIAASVIRKAQESPLVAEAINEFLLTFPQPRKFGVEEDLTA